MRRRKQTEAFSLFSFQDIITSVTGIIILLTLFLTLQVVQPKSFGTGPGHAASDADLERSIQQIDGQIEQMRKTLKSGREFLRDFAGLSPASLDHEEARLKQTIARLQSETLQLRSDIAAVQRQSQSLLTASEDSPANDELAVLRKRVESLKQQLASLKATNRVVYNIPPDVKKVAWLVDLSNGSIKVAKPGSKDVTSEFEDKIDSRAIEQFLTWAGSREPASDYFVLLVRPHSLPTYRQVYERLDELDFAIGVDLLERDATLIDLSDISTSTQ